jgi:hypothetical protein
MELRYPLFIHAMGMMSHHLCGGKENPKIPSVLPSSWRILMPPMGHLSIGLYITCRLKKKLPPEITSGSEFHEKIKGLILDKAEYMGKYAR